jgi:hypothetical protein
VPFTHHGLRKSWGGFLFLFALFSLIVTGCKEKSEEITLTINGHTLEVEVARTPEERREGLKHRKNMDADHGMLFVFERDRKLSFWMKETYIPLTIAYIAKDGTIKEIHRMEPLSTRQVESNHSVRYALEVNQGLFEQWGIGEGDTITFPDGFR